MKKILIQGDVCLFQVDNAPTGAKKIESVDNALAYGEHSGHAHVINGAEIFESDGNKYVVVGEDANAALSHIHLPTGRKADHDAIVLSPNTVYQVRIQNEYNPYEKAMKQVID